MPVYYMHGLCNCMQHEDFVITVKSLANTAKEGFFLLSNHFSNRLLVTLLIVMDALTTMPSTEMNIFQVRAFLP